MGIASRNPLIDRYYSPLASTPDFDEYQREVDEARAQAIEMVKEKLHRAEEMGRTSEIRLLRETLRELHQLQS